MQHASFGAYPSKPKSEVSTAKEETMGRTGRKSADLEVYMCFSKGLVQFVSYLKPYEFYMIYIYMIYYMIYVGFKPLQYFKIIYIWNVLRLRNLAGWYSVMSK